MQVELDELMTSKEFAKLKGISAPSVSLGMDNGRIPFVQIRGARLVRMTKKAINYKPRKDRRREAKESKL